MAEVSDIKMTELKSVVEALALIDEGLGGLAERQLISTSEVTDLLLDVRSLLSEPTESAK